MTASALLTDRCQSLAAPSARGIPKARNTDPCEERVEGRGVEDLSDGGSDVEVAGSYQHLCELEAALRSGS
jgi:hypothetical protein